MKKIYFLLSVSLMLMLAGCASRGFKEVSLYNRSVVIGWKNQKMLGPGYYVLIERNSRSWTIKKISLKPITGRENKMQEILFVSKNLNYVQPFFEKPSFYNSNLRTFQCTPLLEKGKFYTPCNSYLTTANAGASVARDALALVSTFGLAAGIDYEIDTKKISNIIKQTNLLKKVKLYKGLTERFLSEKKRYYDFASNIILNIKKIKDNTRLYLIKPNDISGGVQKRLTREIVNLPKDLDYSFDKYNKNDIKNLFVGKEVEVQPYLINPIIKTHNYYILKCFGIIPEKYTKIKIPYDRNYTHPEIDIPITINTCDVINPYPSNFIAKDKNILIKVMSLNKNGIRLLAENKTISYIKILSATLYYRDKVLDISNLDIELPPKSLKKDVYIPAIGFDSLAGKVNEFKKINKNKLKFLTLSFGLAIKYNIVATNIEKTLYKTNMYSLASILFQN